MTRAGCWPTPETSRSACWGSASTEDKEAAADVAAAILWYGTGGQFDLCPVVYRPCDRCSCGCEFWTAYIQDGHWRNGCRNCLDSCCGVRETILPSNSYGPVTVNLDGVQLVHGTDFRIDNYRRLVRTNDLSWPHCQDMSLPPGSVGTFTVTYTQSRLDAAGVRAYARLTGEILSSWVDPGNCRLPEGITSVTREGIVIDFTVLGALASRTGIVEVDLWLRMVNPTGQPNAQSLVLSPDLLRRPPGRVTTWGV